MPLVVLHTHPQLPCLQITRGSASEYLINIQEPVKNYRMALAEVANGRNLLVGYGATSFRKY